MKTQKTPQIKKEDYAQATLRCLGAAVITTDAASRVVYLNAKAEALTGWSEAEALGQPLGDILCLLSGLTQDPVDSAPRNLLHLAGESCQRFLLKQRSEQRLPIDLSVSPLPGHEPARPGVALVFQDATEAHLLAHKLSWHEQHDGLTELKNRSAFEQALERMLDDAKRKARAHALLYIDLDQFKVINDTSGHIAGDYVLREVAWLLARQLRRSDTIARLGGDEFGILLHACPIESARKVAETLRRAVAELRLPWEDKTFEISASIGLVALNADTKSAARVLSTADAACYVAKDKGRNRVQEFFGGVDCMRKHKEMEWVLRINKALEENRFVLFYQTIAPLGDPHAPRQREILLRLVDEEGQIVAPMSFIPAAEKYNLMTSIDRWVVGNVLRFLREQPGAAGRDIWTINLSGQSLGDDHFLAFVIEGLAGSGVDPRRICFEITETAAIADIARAQRFMGELKKLHCRFALDDFGSGMSSYAYLKNLPVDFVKIDGAFVKNITKDTIDFVMVESFNRISHIMGIQTVAEFVEDEMTAQRLREIEVDYVQGYHIHRPEPLPR